jgi:hypothetical protein
MSGDSHQYPTFIKYFFIKIFFLSLRFTFAFVEIRALAG